ncbi:prenyltransferase [Candidatus Bathyarchaeota archaeon]|nr:MAG: prenyltransferase [Candidatus Bathyarchaeota archaeon]
MTFVATCLAGIMAYTYGSFNIFLFILTMIGLLIAHTAANMANDWYDVKHGVDENAPTAEYRPHPLLFGQVDKRTYKMVVFALYAIGLSISLYLTWVQGIAVMIFSILGVLFGVFYTADPIKLKHHSVGEISVFLAFGPLMVGGAFYAITGVFSWDPMFASVPIGLLVALVLLANNIRDKDFDAKVGISTVATDVQESTGMNYYKALLALAYITTIILVAARVFSPFALISFISIKEALNIVKEFSVKVPLTSDQQTAQLALHFGVLLTLGELLNVIYYTYF